MTNASGCQPHDQSHKRTEQSDKPIDYPAILVDFMFANGGLLPLSHIQILECLARVNAT